MEIEPGFHVLSCAYKFDAPVVYGFDRDCYHGSFPQPGHSLEQRKVMSCYHAFECNAGETYYFKLSKRGNYFEHFYCTESLEETDFFSRIGEARMVILSDLPAPANFSPFLEKEADIAIPDDPDVRDR